jgi:D-aspartate ligase
MDKISVLIPDGENEHALWVVRSLADSKQVRLHVLSSKRWMPVRFSRHCRLYEFSSTGADYARRLSALADITRRIHVDVILPVSEEGVLFAATERETLSKLASLPPIPEPESLKLAKSKWQLNQFACQNNLPVPQAILVTFDPAFDQRVSALEYPVLLKPTTLTDGQGIRRFDTPSDLLGFLKSQDEEMFEAKYLVQTYIPGSDVGLSVLCQDGEILAHSWPCNSLARRMFWT